MTQIYSPVKYYGCGCEDVVIDGYCEDCFPDYDMISGSSDEEQTCVSCGSDDAAEDGLCSTCAEDSSSVSVCTHCYINDIDSRYGDYCTECFHKY